MKKYLQSLITGTVLGTTLALGIFIAQAAISSGEEGIPAEGLYTNLFTKILVNPSPNTDGKVKNTQELDGVPAADYQLNVNGACPNNQWAVGINTDNSIACRNW